MDYCDMAASIADFDLALALDAQKRRAAAATAQQEARPDCLVCGDAIPLVRQQHGFSRCVDCQTRIEKQR